MKTTWKFINTETGRNKKPNYTQHLIDIYKGQNIAELLIDHFSTIANKLISTINNKLNNTTDSDFKLFMEQVTLNNYPTVYNKPSTVEEIEKIIYSLKSEDSCGYDQISTRVLKLCAPYIISPLTYICNLIIFSGNFPEKLKYSEIIPLYKKGDKKQITNYRPISLLTSFSKIVEKIMLSRLLIHLKKYNILSLNQYGFQKNVSVDDAIFALLNETLTALKNKSKVKGIFCDTEEAFGCVNHDILLQKMEMYGITGSANEIIY
jgi:hypothetical protein